MLLLRCVTNDSGYYVAIKAKPRADNMSCGVLIVIAALTGAGKHHTGDIL